MSNRLISRAVMQRRAIGTDQLLDRLFASWFTNFVYNQIWEDPDVDLDALGLDADSRVVTIASGGCNVLNYLVAAPRSIVAIDLNPAHIALTRLKLAAVQYLPDHESFFQFFGSAAEQANRHAYERYLRPHLDETTLRYWESRTPTMGRRIDYFIKGLYRRSLLGRFIGAGHQAAKLFGIDPSRMLKATTIAEQQRIFDESVAPVFDRKLVRALLNLPMSLYSLGIPPAQFEALKRDSSGDISGLLRERLRRLACDFPIGSNYFAWQAFSRSYDCEGRQAIPAYLRAENFAQLRDRARCVETRLVTMTELLTREIQVPKYDAYVLLDAQDWMGKSELNALWTQIARTSRPGARVIFRTAARLSPLETALEPEVLRPWSYDSGRSQELLARDRSAVYGGFHLYRRAA